MNTALLAAGVVVASIVVAVPPAWLVTRTDLPWRGALGDRRGAALVIPSYVAALCAARVLRRARAAPAGARRRAPARSDGYWGRSSRSRSRRTPTCPCSRRRRSATSTRRSRRRLAASASRGERSSASRSRRCARPLGSLLVALYVLSDFGVVSLMRYDSLTRAIYLQYRSLFDRTPAAVLALVLVGSALALALELRTRTRGRLWRTEPGRQARRAPSGPLGRCPPPRSLVLRRRRALPGPAGRRARYWLGRGLRTSAARRPLERGGELARRVGAAAVVAVAAALPVAILALPLPVPPLAGAGAALLRRNALPGLVIALSLVFFAARYASPVYQTLALLVFAYVVRFFPQALSGVDTALAGQPTDGGGARGSGAAARDHPARHRAARPLRHPRGRRARLPVGDEGAARDDPAPADRLRHAGHRDLDATQVGAYSQARSGARPDRRLGARPLARPRADSLGWPEAAG